MVETIFNIPGLGRLAIQSIFARDYPVAMAIILLFTLFYAADQSAWSISLRRDRSAAARRARRPSMTDLPLAAFALCAVRARRCSGAASLRDPKACAGAAIVLAAGR